jgi:hypothetical protein
MLNSFSKGNTTKRPAHGQWLTTIANLKAMPQRPKECTSPPEEDSHSTRFGRPQRQRAVAGVVLVGVLVFLVSMAPDEAGAVGAVVEEEEGLKPVPWGETGAMQETSLQQTEHLDSEAHGSVRSASQSSSKDTASKATEPSPHSGAKTKKHPNQQRRKKADEADPGESEKNDHEAEQENPS